MDFGWLLYVNIGSSLIFKKCIFVVRDVDNGGSNAHMGERVYGKSSRPYTYRGCIYWAYYSRKTERKESGLRMTSLTTVLTFQVLLSHFDSVRPHRHQRTTPIPLLPVHQSTCPFAHICHLLSSSYGRRCSDPFPSQPLKDFHNCPVLSPASSILPSTWNLNMPQYQHLLWKSPWALHSPPATAPFLPYLQSNTPYKSCLCLLSPLPLLLFSSPLLCGLPLYPSIEMALSKATHC